jgi:hypothetical protein
MMIQRMRNLSALLSFAFLAFVISSCAQPTGPASSSDVSFGGGKIPVTTSTWFSVNPAPVNETMTVSGSVGVIDDLLGDVVGGKIQIEMWDATIDNGDGTFGAWVKMGDDVECMSGVDVVNYDYTPTSVGAVKFRTHYIPSGGSNYSQDHALEATLMVTEGCIGDVSLAVQSVTSAINGSTATYTIVFNVKACVDVSGVKLQGGLTAGSTPTSWTGTKGVLTSSQKNKNWTMTAAIGAMSAGETQTYTVIFTKKVAAGTNGIAGAWSAKGIVVSTQLPTEYNYTSPITYTN